jgi:putative modified peptide
MAGVSKSGSDLDALINRCLNDDAFRQQLQDDPAAALRAANLYTPEREQAVRRLAWPPLQNLAEAFGHGQGFAN